MLRGDRQTPAQVKAHERSWEIFGVPLQGIIDPRQIFPDTKRQIMEIGTGTFGQLCKRGIPIFTHRKNHQL